MYEVEQMVGGEWRQGTGPQLVVADPADGGPVSRVRSSTRDDVAAAVKAARDAAAG